MPNIFDAINKMDEEQLRNQLASLEEMNVANILSEMGQKTKRGAVKLYNGLLGLMKKQAVAEPEVISLEQRVEIKKRELDKLGKSELQSRTKKVLIEKVNSASISLIENESDDEVSAWVIQTATKCFKKEIEESLTVAQKADAIYHRYNERLLSQTQQKYKEATPEQKKEIDAALQREVDAMSDTQKKELQEALGIEKITGEAMGKILKTTAGGTALLVALDVSGFGAYMALTTIMHAVFTTTLGITLPFAVYTTSTGILSFFLGPGGWLVFAGIEAFMLNKNKNKIIYELLAQVVWSSVLVCGGRFTPKEDSLPSWLPAEQRADAERESAELLSLMGKYKKLEAERDSLKTDLEKNDLLIKKKEEKIQDLKKKNEEQAERERKAREERVALENECTKNKEELSRLQGKLDAMESESVSPEILAELEEAKRKCAEAEWLLKENDKTITNLNNSVSSLTKEIGQYEEELENAWSRNEALQAQNQETQSKLDEATGEVERLANKEQDKLQGRWEKAYKKFIFAPGVMKSVVKNYEYNELGSVEGALMEIHEANDPAGIRSNRGKMAVSEEYHMEFSTRSGFPSRIFYKTVKNMPGGKTVEITYICKHNDSRYGKVH